MSHLLLDSIVIGERVRKDMGDIESLAASIQRHGLLHPIVVKTDNTLVAGHRRVEAARSIGWSEIPVTVIDVADLLSAERDENAERKDFTPTEAVAIGRLIEEQHKAKIEANRSDINRKATAIREAKRHGTDVPNQHRDVVPAGKTHVVVANAIGMGRNKYVQAKAVVDAAETDPETFGDLPEQMDESGNVNGAHEEMKRRKGNGKARHPVHKKSPFPKPNREMDRSIFSLDGICTCLQAIDPKELERDKTKAWAKALKKSASIISRVARRIENVKAR